MVIRPIEKKDYDSWIVLWDEYCEFYRVQVPTEVTKNNWERFFSPDSAVKALVSVDETGTKDSELLGFAHYVTHPHTWSRQTLCYLEDLYVAPKARKQNVGHSLIESLVELGKKNQWKRVYWHTETENLRARRLYDRFSPADGYVRYTINL